jgi:hypothetical protein
MCGYIRCRISRNDRRPGRAQRGKSSVRTIRGAVAVGGHDPEMIGGVRR